VKIKRTLWVTDEEFIELASIGCINARRERMREIAGRPLGSELVRARRMIRPSLVRLVVEAQA